MRRKRRRRRRHSLLLGRRRGRRREAESCFDVDRGGDRGRRSGSPAPSGEERRLIGDYIRNHTREIRDCYERRLQERKTLQGKLVARFDIGPSGRVIGATADGMGDRELALCVVRSSAAGSSRSRSPAASSASAIRGCSRRRLRSSRRRPTRRYAFRRAES